MFTTKERQEERLEARLKRLDKASDYPNFSHNPTAESRSMILNKRRDIKREMRSLRSERTNAPMIGTSKK